MHRTSIASLEDFRKLRPVWDELLLGMEYPIVFLTWEWIHTWWEHFGDSNREPVILIVSDGEKVKGILPLYAERMILRNYWLNGRILSHCSATELFPDHIDIIAAPDQARECLRSIVHFLATEYRDWDVVRIPMVASSSRLLGWLRDDAVAELCLDLDVEQESVAYYIPINATFDEYFDRFDAKQRYNIRSRVKKLYQQHGVRYATCDGEQAKCLQRVFALHRQRATRKGIASSFVSPRVHAFHEALAARILERNWLSVRCLERESEVIAASYNFEVAGRVFSYQKGFDPQWERYGPGNVLIYELIREAFANRRLEYNFLQGNEAYKSVWTQDYRTLSSVNIYNDSLLGRAARSGYRLKRALKRRFGRQHVQESSALSPARVPGRRTDGVG